MSRYLLSGVAAVAIVLGSSAGAMAQEKISIMVGGIEKQIYLPARLAQELGYFKDEGLDVELLSEPSGVSAEDEMLAGAVQGVVGFYDHTIDLQAKGKYVESVVQFSQAPGEVELVSAKQADTIKSPADFKGKTLGVTGLGSSTNFITEYLAVKNGVQVSEITPLPVGAGNTFIAAMTQGKIDAGMTTEPTISQLLKSGQAKILVDMRSPDLTRKALGGVYPAASLYMPTAWVESHKDEVQKLANAFVKTMKYIATHDGAEIAAHMPKDYYVGDKDAYVKALDNGKEMFTPDGRMPEDGPSTVLKVLSTFDSNVKGKDIDLSKTYTTSFVDAAK
jgi:NitT/TauT family transport system substrate-binding protein